MSKLTIPSGYPFEEIFGYARAVRVGDHVFVSGTTARGPDLERDAYHQACSVLDITDRADIDSVARAHGHSFAAVRPASTLVMVAGLTPTNARVEIEATAVVQG
jgi:enamine deaminase RidA (YjgF/YER057c/UK114 family)